jgi:TonB family protein
MSKIAFLPFLALGAACLAGCATTAPSHDVYGLGSDKPSDIYKSWYLYRQLADNNTVAGEISLADLSLRKSDGYRTAYYWYRRAVLDGNAIAAANLWYLYTSNHSGPGEDPEAVTFYHLAAQSDEGRRQLLALETKAAIDSERHYPKAAAEEQGTVIVEFNRGEDGKASDVKVYRSSGNADIDNAAIEAVQNATLPDIPPGLTDVHHFIISVKIAQS